MDTDPAPTESTEAPDPATPTSVMPAAELPEAEPDPSLPWPDRAGERLADEARALVHRGRGLAPDQRGAAGAIVALLVFLVLLALLSHV